MRITKGERVRVVDGRYTGSYGEVVDASVKSGPGGAVKVLLDPGEIGSMAVVIVAKWQTRKVEA